MKLTPIIGIVLLGAAFALSAVQLWTRASVQQDPNRRIIHIGHFMIHAGMREGLDEAIANYERLHPDVLIVQDAVPLKAWSVWQRAQWAGDTTPDIMQLGKGTGDLELGRYYLALSPWIESPNPYNQGTPLAGISWRDTFVDGLGGGSGYSAALGDSYGIPSQVNTLRLFYNRELLRLITGSDTPPATFEELLALGRLAHKRRPGIVPLALSGPYAGFVFDALSLGFTHQFAQPLTPSRNLRPEPIELGRAALAGRWSLATPAIRAALESWADLAAICAPNYLNQEREDAQFYFVTGRSLFLVAGSWDNAGVRQEAEFDVGVAPFPYPETNDKRRGTFTAGAPSEANAGFGAEFGVSRSSRHPDLAVDFLRYLTSYTASARLTEVSHRLPAIVNVPVSADLAPFLPREEGVSGGFSIAFNTLPGGNTALLLRRQWHLLAARNGHDAAAAVDEFLAAVNPGWLPALKQDIARAPVQRLQTLRAADVRITFATTDERTTAEARTARIVELREATLDQEMSLHQLREKKTD